MWVEMWKGVGFRGVDVFVMRLTHLYLRYRLCSRPRHVGFVSAQALAMLVWYDV